MKQWNLEQYQNDPEFWMHVSVGEFRAQLAEMMEQMPDMTQRKLAEALGLSEARVSALLHGSPNLTMKTMCQIAGVFGKKLEVKMAERASLAQSQESDSCQAGIHVDKLTASEISTRWAKAQEKNCVADYLFLGQMGAFLPAKPAKKEKTRASVA